ncbi:tenecin-1 [Cylas formicarius]|uniref:tenecin-1 n=1 Tax=Cylas formicarius TaxID=197179 RepID=UPI0029587A2F|nr:tenecin-1 [Cylas formicarius]
MKYTFVFCFAVVIVFVAGLSNAAPVDEEFLDDTNQEHVRVKRVTCDVLSVEAKGIKLNDAACGLHCLYKGRSGGYCNGKRICVCR